MSKVVAIVDYGLGNLGSVSNMLRKLGVGSVRASTPEELGKATALILPGVGHYDTGMGNLRARGFEPVLNELVLEKNVPVLGICLGVQLLARGSEEGSAKGLGWIAADVRRFTFPEGVSLPVPHMGWNEVEVRDAQLFKGHQPGETRYYFVHSFHLVCDDQADVAASATYGYRFTAAIHRGNIFGSQFHPEKSHKHGMAMLKNWLEAVGHAA